MKIRRLPAIAAAIFLLSLLQSLTGHAVACQRPPLPQALDALASDSVVAVSRVEVDSWDGTTPAPADDNIYYAFEPKRAVETVGFIILPGGNSDPRCYAPAANEIAAQGFFTCIIPMPNCVAIPGYMRADIVIKDHEQIKKWVIGGHSVGSTAAGIYAKTSNTISGVVIWASFVDSSTRLDDTALKVLSVTGSLDGRATPELVKENAIYLPKDTVFVEIEGGNHTQFGWIDTSPLPYLSQDNAATITIEEQQKQIVQATTDFLKQFAGGKCPITYLFGKEDLRTKTVRRLRNELLVKSSLGLAIIELYNKQGANIIEIFEKSTVFKNATGKAVESLIPVIEIFL